MKRIRSLHTLSRKKKVIELAAAGLNSLGISGDEWDRDPYKLAFQNDVMDLRTFEYRQGLPGDYLRKKANAIWTSMNELAPIWEKTLLKIFDGNKQLVAFFQRALGMSLCGKIQEHVFFILWGKNGRNGKTLILETIAKVLAKYVGSIRSETLLKQAYASSSSGPTPDIMRLRGKRMVWASETDEGRILNVGKIKNLSGGDTIVGRDMYAKRETSFEPEHTLFLLTNNRPIVPPNDFALWERICIIPFKLSFIDNPKKSNQRKVDRKLGEKLETELSGIAAWLLRGLMEYREKGFKPSR